MTMALLEMLLTDANGIATCLRAAVESAKSVSGLSSAGFQVLKTVVEHGEQTVARIGRLSGTSRQNTRMLVRRLIQGGLVEFVDNPEHQRASLVRITEPGLTLFNLVVDRRNEALSKSFSTAPEADLKAASIALRRIAQSLGLDHKVTIASHSIAEGKVVRRPRVTRRPVAQAELAGVPDQTEENQLPVNLL